MTPRPTLAGTVSAILLAAAMLAGCASSRLENPVLHEKAVIVNLGQNVNSSEDDFAADMHGDRLVFTSKRPTVEGYIQGDDMWFTDREGAGWSQALNFGGAINSERDEGTTQITPDGSTVFYVQCETADGLGDADIYQASFDRKGTWQAVKNLGELNTKYWDSNPYLSPDGENLYFSSDRPGGIGGTDIWVSKKLRSGKWGPPRNLGPIINTSGNEKSPMIAPNGDLFFSSDKHPGLGGYDLFRSKDLGKKGWGTPENIGRPFNSDGDDMFFRLSAQEDTVYISSNREGGLGGLDLYLIAPNPYKDTSRYIYYLAGQIFDSVSTIGLKDANVRLMQGDKELTSLKADKTGRFRVRIEPGDKFLLTAEAKGYEPRSTQVTVPKTLSYSEYRRSLGLVPVQEKPAEEKKKEEPDLHLVYFDFDKDVVRSDGTAALDVLFNGTLKPMLDAKKEFEITLDAHTDDKGTEEYNISLSRRRAAAVTKYLKGKGVPLSSVTANAYGESRPADPNTTDEGRQHNRRVEIRVHSGETK